MGKPEKLQMISKEMAETLQQIRTATENNGACLARDIDTYEYKSNLYTCLKKLERIDAVKKTTAPNTARVQHTYIPTEFGETLLEKIKNTEMIK